MSKEPDLIDVIKRMIVISKKIHKAVNPYHIPNDLESMKAMKERLEKEEERRNEINKTREALKVLIRKKKNQSKLKKIDRHRKIRKFLHMKDKTYNEMGLFEN